MRLLLVKLSSLGDVVHSTYALSDALSAIPDLRIDWMVEEAFADIAKLHPAVDEVIPVKLRAIRKGPGRLWNAISHGRELRRQLRRRHYDLVIDAQGLLKSAVLARLAGVPISGPDREGAREPVASLFYSEKIDSPLLQHAATRTRRLFADALGYDLDDGAPVSGLPVDALAEAGHNHLLELGIRGPYLLLAHGSAWPTKTWDPARWRAVAEQAAGQGHSVVIPAGSPSEQETAEAIAAALDGVHVLPPMGLSELLPLLAACGLVAGVDSGLTHLAEALGLPGVMLMGPTDPRRTGPLGSQVATIMSNYSEAPCYRRTARDCVSERCCMDGVSVEAVQDAMTPLLTAGAPRPARAVAR